jgi:hypothetical protein
MDPCLVVAADVGSIRGKFAWAAAMVPAGRPQSPAGGTTPIEMLPPIAAAIEDGLRVAVGWEAPMMLPVPDTESWLELGRARIGEGNRSWSAGAGTGALATGLVQVAWFCRALAQSMPDLRTTCDPQKWRERGGLLLWEAFVSGHGKPTPMAIELADALPSQHETDAAAAVAAFTEALKQDPALARSHVTTGNHRPLSLLAFAAHSGGLAIDAEEMTQSVLVIKTPTPSDS